ncbi:hypothetical protein NEOLEDRAFT_1127096 [Neolentinus lepideus HHB14362 ss-1]|uniref:Uncharacterized protein n=1 Tax=Neolentinus lepideus HHB14362 ss-1 TaxID=1314782 RepID=A0A165VU61_9AGAM|nr:hypothetical protein NEOLEDRAFT_1127096 [Neolentinus lepideus HHB14362 ss-1]
MASRTSFSDCAGSSNVIPVVACMPSSTARASLPVTRGKTRGKARISPLFEDTQTARPVSRVPKHTQSGNALYQPTFVTNKDQINSQVTTR